MQMCAGLKEHMREVIDYVICALCMVCLGSAVSWNRQDCNSQACNECKTRPVASLGRQDGRRVFWEGPRFFKLCPTHFFRGGKIFSAPHPSYGLVQNTWSVATGLCLNAQTQNVVF